MMSKKEYERAARLVQMMGEGRTVDLLERFFAGDNPRFDGERFRAACVPGANVKARGLSRVREIVAKGGL